MRVIEVSQFGGPEMLQLQHKEVPVAGPGEVVVQVEAIGVNPVETYIRAGVYPVLPQLPYIPGGNVAGTVASCGPGVTALKAGQRVYTAMRSGGYAEFCLCITDEVFALPDCMSFNQGAVIGVPAATAYRALFMRGGGKAGDKVLVHGASGSVGMAAVQLGLAAGMVIDGTAGTQKGLQTLTEMGVKQVFCHSREYFDQLRDAASEGYDLILEMLANKNLERDLELLAPGGRVVIIGSRGRIEIDPRLTMGKETEIRGLALARATPKEIRETHAALYKAMEEGVLQPAIGNVLPLEQAPAAHIQVMEDGKVGKIILKPT